MGAKELRDEASYIEEQEALAAEALKRRGKLARFWRAEYGVGIGNRLHQFMGLACNSCNRWEDYEHEKDCDVAELERLEKP